MERSISRPMVSVIVPVYNCERYVDECINSLLQQTYSNIELIIVNDGSTDDSLDICKKYEKIDSRIKIFEQENQGVSNARNRGIKEARGKFISFVDADDYVDESFVQDLVDIMPEKGIAICGYKRLEHDVIGSEYIVKGKLDIELLYRNIFARGDIACGCCNKLFSTNTIRKYNLRFDYKLNIGEDMLFLAEYLKYTQNNFRYADKANYIYRKNMESSMQSAYFKQTFDDGKATCLDAVKKLDLLYDNPEPYIEKCFSYRIVRSSLWLLFQMISCNSYEKTYANQIKRNVRKKIINYLKYGEGTGLEHIMACMTYINPKCVFMLGKLIKNAFPKYVSKYLN